MKKIVRVLSASFCFLACGMDAAEPKENRENLPPALCDLPRFWVDVEYLFWEIQNPPEPVPLVVGSSAGFTDNVLDQLGTFVALGDKDVDLGWRSGGKFSAGYRFCADRRFGLEANYFFLPNESETTGFNSRDSGYYFYVPYIDARTDAGDSIVITVPDQYGGPISLKVSNKMQGAEANMIGNVLCRSQGSIDLLAGFRYLNFKEDLTFSVVLPYVFGLDPPFVADIFQTTDQFDTTNNFYGGQFGVKTEYFHERFFLQAVGKIALGAMCGKVNIQGELVTNEITGGAATPAYSYPGGYFTMPSNIGKYTKTSFSCIPEVSAKLGYICSDWLRIQVGYMVFYMLNVLRAGNQIDRKINPSQSSTFTLSATPTLVGAARPKALLSTSGVWVQGLTAGVEFRY